MSTLRDLRRQLKSVENIKKITDAMERVAAVHLRRAQQKAEQSIPYVQKMKEILDDLTSLEFSHPLFEKRPVKKICVVIFSSDKGLSGAYNANLFTKADQFLKKYDANQVELIVIGHKALSHYKKKPWTIKEQILDWGGKISLERVHQLSNQLVEGFIKKDFDEVFIIYTHYISLMRREVIIDKFLNICKQAHKQDGPKTNYIIEPNSPEIFAQIIPRYCFTLIQTAFDDAYASELAARIVAMQSASKNSAEMIEHLTLVKNKVRQRDITREMIEITSGAEGLK